MHRSAVAFALALAASALTATPAEAADIATILGTPGDATWTAACGAGATLPTGRRARFTSGPASGTTSIAG